MNRRQFIKNMGVASAVALVPTTVLSNVDFKAFDGNVSDNVLFDIVQDYIAKDIRDLVYGEFNDNVTRSGVDDYSTYSMKRFRLNPNLIVNGIPV